MPNVKYLAFGTPNTKKSFLWGVLNPINFDTHEQFYLIFGTIQTDVLKKIFISSLFFYYFSFFSLLLFLLSSSVCSLSLVTPSSLFLLLSSQHLYHMASGFFFSIHFLCTSFSLFYLFFPITISLSLSLSLLSIAFIADLHSSRPIPFTTSHLVMTESWSASTITPSPSLSTLVSTKKKAISIRYSRMCLRDSGGYVIEETVAGKCEEGDFGTRLWVCLIWDGFWGLWMWWVVVDFFFPSCVVLCFVCVCVWFFFFFSFLFF